MHVALLTREYPPEVYGGAGVHVEYLARELARLAGRRPCTAGAPTAPRRHRAPARVAHRPWEALDGTAPYVDALRAVSIDLAMAAGARGRRPRPQPHLVRQPRRPPGHSSCTASRTSPRCTASSRCAPGRPSSSAAATRCRASASARRSRPPTRSSPSRTAMRDDILAAYPAIDPARVAGDPQRHRHRRVRAGPRHRRARAPRHRPGRADRRRSSGASPARRASRTCSRAARDLDPAAQLVLCAGAPDTPEIGAEVAGLVDALQADRGNVIWIDTMLPRPEVIQILTHATVFVCPSIYEPLGIVNLEAMACETAVVATATGGIPEVVDDGETGLLVPLRPARRRHARAARPRGVRRGDRRARQRAARRPPARAGDGPCGPRGRRAALRLGRDRRADERAVPPPGRLTLTRGGRAGRPPPAIPARASAPAACPDGSRRGWPRPRRCAGRHARSGGR